MEFSSRQRNIRVTPRKLRLLIDLVRGKDVQVAIDQMQFNAKSKSNLVLKMIRSAVNNASQNRGVNVDKLFVKKILVDKGPTMKRFMPRARGGASTILKRTSHLTVILDERQ
ncbi:MAG: 50S ribosomal protein L22 [Deltaproteobacteria bacterium]|nr:50S ribosomal protein L22 [Deltaproteobacteria bacterium]